MLDHLNEKDFRPHPKLVRALEVLFIIHAEHEVGCSTSLVRHLASAGVDLYTTIGMAAGALYGPKHGGANTAVINMLEQIGSKDRIRRFLMEVKLKKRTLYGFGNRVYKNFDPRSKIVKQVFPLPFRWRSTSFRCVASNR
jgi:citrate synthase